MLLVPLRLVGGEVLASQDNDAIGEIHVERIGHLGVLTSALIEQDSLTISERLL
jgi:hypothetical protein